MPCYLPLKINETSNCLILVALCPQNAILSSVHKILIVILSPLTHRHVYSSSIQKAMNTLFLEVIICLITILSANTNTFVTEESSSLAALTTSVLSVKMVIWPSDSGWSKIATSVRLAIVSPTNKGKHSNQNYCNFPKYQKFDTIKSTALKVQDRCRYTF